MISSYLMFFNYQQHGYPNLIYRIIPIFLRYQVAVNSMFSSNFDSLKNSINKVIKKHSDESFKTKFSNLVKLVQINSNTFSQNCKNLFSQTTAIL